MKKDTNKAADLCISLLVIAISIIFLIEARGMQKSARGIGSGDYPGIICVVLIVMGVVQAVKVVVLCKGLPVIDLSRVNVRFLVRALIMVIGTYVYYKMLKPVGFLLTTPLYLFGASMLFGYRKKIKAAVISILFSTAVYFLFVKVFLVILPRGILG